MPLFFSPSPKEMFNGSLLLKPEPPDLPSESLLLGYPK